MLHERTQEDSEARGEFPNQPSCLTEERVGRPQAPRMGLRQIPQGAKQMSAAPERPSDVARRLRPAVAPPTSGPAKRGADTAFGRFEGLASTVVYRTLPVGVRATVDSALLLHPADSPAAADVHQKLRLGERYGLRVTDVRRYAEALEAFARPLMAGLAVSSLLNAFPRKLVRGLARGNRILAWSRLVQNLVDPEAPPLRAGEFAKLAAILRPAKRGSGQAGKTLRTRRKGPWCEVAGDTPMEELLAAIGTVYGVSPTDRGGRPG